LNAFWEQHGGPEGAEKIWNYVNVAKETDINKNGVLDEFEGHKFLEKCKEEMTVMQMRQELRKTGAIGQTEKPKTIPLTHVLLFRFGVDWHVLVNAAQGDNAEELRRAQEMLQQVQAALEEMQEKERAAKKAEAELQQALAELKAQEDAYNNRTEELKRKSSEGGVVSKNKAKNELAQHLAEDPLPLRRAKINTEAAVKKAERATAEAEQAVAEATRQYEECEAYLHELQSKGGSGLGALWWMDRELHEAKAYLPQAKGGYKK